MSFALKLKELRENKGLSQAALAHALHVGVGSVGMWESTDRIPPVKKLVRIADYFRISIDELLEHDSYSRDNMKFSYEEREILELYNGLRSDLKEAFWIYLRALNRSSASTTKKKA